MIKKHKKVCRVLNCYEHSLIVVSTITRCVSISAFASVIGIPIRITSSAKGLKICVIMTGIKKYKSINKKNKKKHDKISLAKCKLNSIQVLISKALTDLNISHDEFVVIHVLKEVYAMKEKIKNSNNE